jgi:dipeptidyl aminopeptidase/acylaminoacyl peptidase
MLTPIVFFALSACGGAAQIAPAQSTTTTASSTTQAVKEAAPPVAAPAEAPAEVVEPTVLTEDQKRRDEALAQKIAPFVDAYSNVDAQLTKDKKHVLFRSNRDGLWQAYLGDTDKPAGTPKKLTSGNERVTSAHLTPDEKYVLFTSDEGADENFRIFRVGLDGAGLTNLTPGAKLHRDAPVQPRLKPNLMVYSARDDKDTKTHVFLQDIAGGEPKEIYTDAQPGFVVDASADGAYALFVRYVSASDQTVFRIDLDDGKATRIFPQTDKRKARVTSAKFSADAKRTYLATDDGGENNYVVMLESNGVISGRYQEQSPATASVSDVAVSPKDDRIAITVDAGNSSTVRLLDAHSLKLLATVKSALGTVSAGEFSDDGKGVTIRQSTPEKPNDVYEADAATGAVKPLRNDSRPGLATMPKVDVTIEKAAAHDGLTIPINLYLPKARGSAKLPTIVLVHGGPSASARIGWAPNTLFFVSQGYAVVEPNIRGSTGFGRAYEMADNKEKRLDALKDLETVNRWARSQSWCDGDRMIITGGSYGGYMTLMALTRQPALWRAGVDMVGVSSLTTLMKTTAGTIRSVLTDEFGDPEREGDLLARLSPLADADKIVAPLFVYQGQNDPRVPRSEADQIVRALRARNVDVEYMVASNEGHSLDRRENRIAYLARVTRFLADETKARK